jgi:hypothetical protein
VSTDKELSSFLACILTVANSVTKSGTETGLATTPTATRLKAPGAMTRDATGAACIITTTAAFTLVNFTTACATDTACELRCILIIPLAYGFLLLVARFYLASSIRFTTFCRCVHPNGCRFEGAWFQDLHHGFGRYFVDTRCMYDGHWKRGKMNGSGAFFLPDGGTFSCSEWVDDFFNERSCDRKFANGQLCCFKHSDYSDSKKGRMRRRWEDGICYDNFWRQDLLALKKPQKSAASSGRIGQSVSTGQMINFRGKLIVVDAVQVSMRHAIIMVLCGPQYC